MTTSKNNATNNQILQPVNGDRGWRTPIVSPLNPPMPLLAQLTIYKKMHFPAHLTKRSGLDGIHFSFYVRRKQLKTMNTCKHNNSGTSEKFISVASLGLVSPGAATNGFTPFFIQKPDDLFFSARWLRFLAFFSSSTPTVRRRLCSVLSKWPKN